MKGIDTLETKFKGDLRLALLRAARGQSPTLFSLGETRARSSARSLRVAAERILELRSSTVEAAQTAPAARYLVACLRWQHVHGARPSAVPVIARELLREL